MGYSNKHHIEEAESKRWVIAGIGIRAPLKPLSIKPTSSDLHDSRDNNRGECCTTPTARESRLPENMPCPPPPRKRRPAPGCQLNGIREFFNPPDLEIVFMCHVKKCDSVVVENSNFKLV